jgi:hypothetical protein
VVHQVLPVRKERKEQQVQLDLLVQQGQQDHKVQPVQRELLDHLEVEAEHLDHKVQREPLGQLAQQVLLAQLVQQVLRVQLVPQVQQVQPELQVLLEFLKLFMECSQFLISTE